MSICAQSRAILPSVSISIMILVTGFCSGCEDRAKLKTYRDLVCWIYDLGSGAPDAGPRSPTFVLWTNGTYVISSQFPLSGELVVGAMSEQLVLQIARAMSQSIATCNSEQAPPDWPLVSLSDGQVQSWIPVGERRDDLLIHLTVQCASSVRSLSSIIMSSRTFAEELPISISLRNNLEEMFKHGIAEVSHSK